MLRSKTSAIARLGHVAGFCLIVAAALPLAVQAAWESTLSKAAGLDEGTATTPLAGDRPLHISLSLKIQNRPALEAFLKNVHTSGNPQYGRYLTPSQFAAAYAPSAQQAQKVVDYLKSAGMKNVTLSDNRLLIRAQTTAAVAEKAFNTSLVQFQKDGRSVYANVKDAQLPDSLGGNVLAVLGLENVVRMKTKLQQQSANIVLPPLTAKASRLIAIAAKLKPGTSDAGPAQITTAFPPTAWDVAYDAGTSPDGSQSTIAISTYGDDDSVVVEDLIQSERQYGLPYVPVEVREDPAGIAAPDSSGDDEWDLDSQSSTAIAHNVQKLILYTGDGSTGSLLWEFNEFASKADAIAGNMSYGTCELDAATGLLLPTIASSDQEYSQAESEGLSWHASTGDDGGVCSPINALGAPLAGVPLLANYPDSSPYVVAVGGTSLFTDADFNYSSEIAWTSGGGGISVLEGAPDWQKGIVPSAELTSIPGLGTITGTIGGGTGVGRGVPDIAMNAGIYLPEALIGAAADTIIGGTHYAVVGTSLSSPLAVGAWARFQSAHCNTLGFAAPAYYALDTTGGLFSTATGFNDVTVGTNGDYVATTGWDYTTGFGSIDLTKVDAALPAAAESCSPVPAVPVAKLTAASTSADSSLTTSFDASGSSDASGSLSYYTLDYGDDTLPLQQTSPAFAEHDYTSPGIYTASLTVRNASGGVSPAATQTLTVAGFPDACTAAGKTLITVPPGSSGIPLPVPIIGDLLPPIPDPLPSQELLSASVSEPASLPGKLMFTIKVTDLSTLPPFTRWGVFFTIPGDTTSYYVAMASDSGTPTFTYGKRGSLDGLKFSVLGLLTTYNELGTLDASSGYLPDGTINLVLDKSLLNLKTGDTLQAFLSTTAILLQLPPSITGATTTLTAGETVDGGSSRFGYTLIGNDLCASGVTLPGGTTTGGTTGGTTTGSTTGGTTGSTTGGTTGSTTGDTTGSTTGSTTGGTTGTTTGGTTGSTTGTTTGGTTGTTTGGTTTGGTTGTTGTTTGGTTTGTKTGGGDDGGAFGFATLLPLLALADRRRRRESRVRRSA